MSKTVDELTDAKILEDYRPTPEEISLILAELRVSPHEEKRRNRYEMLKEEVYELRRGYGLVGSLLGLNPERVH